MPWWIYLALAGGAYYLLRNTSPAVAVSGNFSSAVSPGLHQDISLTVNGVPRTVWIYTPQGLPANPPLVILFHDTDGGGEVIANSGAQALADAQKVVIVLAMARSMPSADWDNHVAGQHFYETYPSLQIANNGDLQLVQAIIVEAQHAFGVDTHRVYTMGLSNGAFFAYFAAAALQGQIAGFASASGGLVTCATTAGCDYTSQTSSCDATGTYCTTCNDTEKPIPVPVNGFKFAGYLTHASDDYTISVWYTCQLAQRLRQLGYPVQSTIRTSGGHNWSPNFAQDAWSFLSQYSS